jgi:transcriptional regulator with XRE-family HTH domain
MKQKTKQKKKISPTDNTPGNPYISQKTKDYAVNIGNRIRLFRELMEMSREDMAVLLEKETSHIEEIERGIILPEIEDYSILWENYGLSIDWIVSGEGKMFSEKRPYTDDISFLTGNGYNFKNPNIPKYKKLFTLMENPEVEKEIRDNLERWKKTYGNKLDRFNNRQPEGHDVG